MPNRLTAVPARPVPPLPRRLSPVVTVADLFMALMLSRPGGLSLRRAWVTPATLMLCGALGTAALVLGLVLLTRGGGPSLAGGAVLLLASVGSLAVLVAGVTQRSVARR